MKKYFFTLLMLNLVAISLNILFQQKYDWLLFLQVGVGLLLFIYGIIYLKKRK